MRVEGQRQGNLLCMVLGYYCCTVNSTGIKAIIKQKETAGVVLVFQLKLTNDWLLPLGSLQYYRVVVVVSLTYQIKV